MPALERFPVCSAGMGGNRLPARLRPTRKTGNAVVSACGRTNRPAVDSRRSDTHEQQAVEARIPALEGAVADLRVRQFHARILSLATDQNSRLSDVIIARAFIRA